MRISDWSSDVCSSDLHERVLDARAGIEIPAIARTAGATARLMVEKVRPGARIVGLLGLPRYDPAFDVDFPRAGARAIHAMRGAHDLVCGPAFPVGIQIGRAHV